ncbi:MAG: nuclear transport factor 2 family protein [Spongiibacteraceae bacterium]
MTLKRKQQICALLKGIESGDEASVAVVNPNKYIQHNPQTLEGGEGLAVLFERLSKSNPHVNIVRVFSDGDFVFAHTEYDFGSPRVGFEVFRFEGDQTVEHWDNIQALMGPNLSGHSMVDGEVEVSDLDKTESNREIVREFVDKVLVGGQTQELDRFIATEYIEHNARLADGLSFLQEVLTREPGADVVSIQYDMWHKLLAEGNFVLSACEGRRDGVHTAFYDLYRVSNGKIAEHWDTIETISPRSEWKNENGKF